MPQGSTNLVLTYFLLYPVWFFFFCSGQLQFVLLSLQVLVPQPSCNGLAVSPYSKLQTFLRSYIPIVSLEKEQFLNTKFDTVNKLILIHLNYGKNFLECFEEHNGGQAKAMSIILESQVLDCESNTSNFYNCPDKRSYLQLYMNHSQYSKYL